MGMGKSVTVGYQYYMGLHMGLGRGPVDELVEIQVGGKQAFKGSVTASGQVTIDKPDLFGGEMKEGGLKGTLEVLMGEPTQSAPARLAGMLGGSVPGFRGMVTLFYDGMVSAMTPYLKTWKMRVRRSTAGWDGGAWYPEKATVVIPVDGDAIHAMNGAHIVYECLTNRDWGGGMDRSRLDDASFRAAADQLYTEGFGLCLRWARQDSVGSFIQTVCDHLAADLYLSRFDGTWHLRLIRADYDPASLPLFDEDSGLLGIDDDDNAASAGSANELVVKWHDPLKDQDRQWRERNLAAIQADGQVLSTTLDYSGLPTAELAGRVAVRELRTRASSLKRFKVRLDRRGYGIEPGQPFRIRSQARGLDGLVLRAGRIEDGTLDSATLTITAVQDVFGLPAGGMTEVQPSGWTPPDRTPQAVTQRVLMEQTWRDLARRTDAANLALIDPSDSYLASVASKPTALSLGYTLETRVGSAAWTARDDGGAFCPSGALTAALGPTETAFTLSDGIDLDFVAVGGAALLGEEIVRVDAFDPATLSGTLGRGCVDTVPASHAAGSRLWFLDEGHGLDPSAYVAGTTVEARLLTQAGGVLDPALAPVDRLTLAQRQGRPYPPGAVLLNGSAYPASIAGPLTISWSHRDRLLQADQLIDTTAGNIGPESGITYDLELYGEDGSLRRTVTGLTTTSYSWSSEADDSGTVSVGTAVFSRNWDDGSLAGQTLYGASGPVQSVVSGRLRLQANGGSDARIRLDDAAAMTDFEATWTAYVTASGDVGLVYRTTYWGSANDTYGYFCGINTSRLLIGKGSNAATGAWAELVGVSLTTAAGAARSIRLRVVGNRHRVWVDDVLLVDFTNTLYLGAGQFGFRVYRVSTGYSDVDDLVIRPVSERLNTQLRYRLWASRDGLESLQVHDHTVQRTA